MHTNLNYYKTHDSLFWKSLVLLMRHMFTSYEDAKVFCIPSSRTDQPY